MLRQHFFGKVAGITVDHALNIKSAMSCCYKKGKHHTSLYKQGSLVDMWSSPSALQLEHLCPNLGIALQEQCA